VTAAARSDRPDRRALTIGIDARAAAAGGEGGSRVVCELLRALAARDDPHRYVLYTRDVWDEPLDGRFAWRAFASPDPLWHVRVAGAASRGCDVLLSTNSYLPAWFARVPVAPMVFDMVAFDPALRPQRRSGLIERATLRPAVARAAALIAISQATADDLVARYPAARGKTVVAPLAAAPALEAPPAAALPDGVPGRDFILAVGTLEPRKNLPRLVAAYRRLPAALQEAHPLVVTGRLGWDAGETVAALDSLGARAIRTGFVPDAQLALLYRRCALFAYPSLGEGFGLPVLEAMAGGAPVLTSDRSSLPEVGGDAAAYCDPTDEAAIAAALRALLEDPGRRAQLAAAGPDRAAEFSWKETARIVLATLERIARPSPLRSLA
jgi:alpha-1,3-rhamnosyl/mannosyltransferase